MDTHARATQPGVVVVAVDDSRPSRAALRWAADYSREVDAELQVLHVLQPEFSDPVSWAPALLSGPAADPADGLDLTMDRLQELFAAVAPEPSWSLRFVEGAPGREIVDFARNAQLLVIGTGEHRGVERLLEGSVSHYCLTHAAAPVVAVPPPPTATETSPLHRDAEPVLSSALS